jgi:hypothetical protein
MFDTPEAPHSNSGLNDAEVRSSLAEARPLIVTLKAAEILSRLHDTERRFPCSGRTQLFFAPPGERGVRREKRETIARSYCDQCIAKEMCKLAARVGREHGMWGGENDEERAAAGHGPIASSRKAISRATRDFNRTLGRSAVVLEAESSHLV